MAKSDGGHSKYEFPWEGVLTDGMEKSFEQNGFFVAKHFLDGEEVQQMLKVLREPGSILQHQYFAKDPDLGLKIRKTKCIYPGNDVTGMFARSERTVRSAEKLLGSEVYHWSSMFIIKEARVGGEHVWHQDHGFWYEFGSMYPDILTIWVALDKCTRENSCKQAIPGSHLLGRFNHSKAPNGQQMAEPPMVKHAMETMGRVYLEMDPGDAFIHHSNLLHRSDANLSNNGRRAFLVCYNTKRNSPIGDSPYPAYNKLDVVSDQAIKECRNYNDFTGKQFKS